MINLATMFDSYGRQARLYPGLLTLFPPLLTVVAWFPALITSSIGATLLTIATSCGLLYGLAVASRTQGKKVEKRLLKMWGGWPTTIWLRHASQFLQPQTLNRYHRYLTANVPGLQLPPAEDEARDQAGADLAYASGVKWLQERCRGKEFQLIEKENAEYGFRRNLRGMRPIGSIVCLIAVAISAIGVVEKYHNAGSTMSMLLSGQGWQVHAEPPATVFAAAIIDLFAIPVWLYMVNDGWVRDAGDQYARALLASCEGLPPLKQTHTPK